MPALAHYSFGTERLVPPEETLARVAPHLPRLGITRCTSVTRLDALGVPTYCSIRPNGLLLQVSNGKGLTDAAARASAVMEALELQHAENPRPERLRRASLEALDAEGARYLRPEALRGFRPVYFGERFLCDWTAGESLVDGTAVWAPASAVYFYCTPCLHDTSTNGLASGNHAAEATLHALYELVERDAMSRLIVDGRLRLRDSADVVHLDSIEEPAIRALVEAIEGADTRVVLMWLPSAIPVHTFWAVLLNRQPLASVSTLNVGWGTHANMAIAASRALTEAAQSRLVFIHGAREDILGKQVYHARGAADSRAFRYFDDLHPTARWEEVRGRATIAPGRDLEQVQQRVVEALVAAGHDSLVRFDLTDPDVGIPVVKVIAPTLRFNHALF
jgi:ribosomal protein S12 methylthiotransferase accessory factor